MYYDEVALLASVLLAAAVGVPIATPGIAGSAGAVALVLVGAARWRTLAPERAPGAGERGSSASRWCTALLQKSDAPGWAGFGADLAPAGRLGPRGGGGAGWGQPLGLWEDRGGRCIRPRRAARPTDPARGGGCAALRGFVLSAAVACAISIRFVASGGTGQDAALDGAQAPCRKPLTAAPGGFAVTVGFTLSGYRQPPARTPSRRSTSSSTAPSPQAARS